MNKSVRMLVISLSLAALTSLSAPERQTFNPDEALGFLETLGTIQMHDDRKNDIIYYYSPDAKLLARLFNARFAPGAGQEFVKAVETFVSAGLLTAGRGDLYVKHVKPECKFMDADELERMVTKRCDNCREGKNYKHCEWCGGRGRCSECGGEGRVSTKITTMYDSRFPQNTYLTTTNCRRCGGNGQCPNCKGQGEIGQTCPVCKGRGRFLDKEEAARTYASTAIQMIKFLCDVGDRTDMPDLLKRDFKNARAKAEEKFKIIRELREEEEAEAREEQERREKAELERQEKARQDAFEAEQRGNGNVADIKVKCYLRLNNGNTVALRGSAMLERNSDILNVFRAGMEASRLVKLRKSECELAKAEQRQALDKDPFSAKPYTDAVIQAANNLADAQRSLNQVEENLLWRLKNGKTTYVDNLTFTISDVPIGVRYAFFVYGLHGSQRVYWVKSITVESKDGLEIVLTNDMDCLIPDYGD